MEFFSSRLTSNSLKVRKTSKEKYNSFNLLYKITLTLGIPIAPIRGKSNNMIRITKAWCLGLFIFKTITLAISFAYAFRMFPGFATPFSYYFFDSFSYITMVTFIVKRRQIYSATKTITDLSFRISPGTFVGSKTIKYEIFLLIGSTAVILIIFIIFFFYQEWEIYLEVIHPVFHISQSTYTWFVVFSVVSIHALSFVTCFVAVLLCYSSYLAAGGLLRVYAATIRGLQERILVIHNLGLLQEISNSIKKLDAAVRSCAFFLFGTVVGNFFAGISVLFSNSVRFQTPVARIYVGLALMGGLMIIMALTSGGDTVSEGRQLLKAALLESNRRVAGRSLSAVSPFLLLSQSIQNADLEVTGCEMFTINKRLALTIMGMIVTYGFLLFQLND
ncbi:uncharacterized protein TNCT_90641 [Trichonephila clavata]|uniref:Uncharacterized protein n=1 Tax=Trichonephila clavata TaxID=2740835 RepID=A0A8X6K6G4_TRICU|nr:uncharacterized protein TNCT_90641 [Trichonephila clavata]